MEDVISGLHMQCCTPNLHHNHYRDNEQIHYCTTLGDSKSPLNSVRSQEGARTHGTMLCKCASFVLVTGIKTALRCRYLSPQSLAFSRNGRNEGRRRAPCCTSRCSRVRRTAALLCSLFASAKREVEEQRKERELESKGDRNSEDTASGYSHTTASVF